MKSRGMRNKTRTGWSFQTLDLVSMSASLPTASVSGTPAAAGKKIAAREWLGVSVLLALLFVFDLLTFNISPTVWEDEVSFTEPAINYVMHGSYTSTVWQFQPLNAFPSVNCPLYTQSIIGWLSLFGTNVLAVRSFNYFLMGVSCLLFWRLLCRFNLVPSVWWRLAFVTVFHFGYYISYMYRSSRPDTLGLCLTLVLVWLFTVQPVRARNFGLLVVSVALPWVSLPSGLFAGMACFCAWLVLGRPRFLQGMVVWAGLLLGVATFAWFMSAHGALQNFLVGVSYVSGEHALHSGKLPVVARIWQAIKISLPAYLGDYSAVILLMGTLGLMILRRRELKAFTNWRVITCSALIFFATPLVFNITGHYAYYYCYTMFIPALILFAAVAFPAFKAPAHSATGILPPLLIAATIVATTLVGLPLRMAIALSFTNIAPRAEIQRQVNAFVAEKDVVFTDDAAFFEVKQRARVVYVNWSFADTAYTPIPGRRMTQADKDSVNKLVIRADRANFFTNCFGGPWRAVTGPFGDAIRWDRVERLPRFRQKLESYLHLPQSSRCPLQIFERVLPETSAFKNQAPAELLAGCQPGFAGF
jgi:hypothetical protein